MKFRVLPGGLSIDIQRFRETPGVYVVAAAYDPVTIEVSVQPRVDALGALAHLGEHHAGSVDVTGSSPVGSTFVLTDESNSSTVLFKEQSYINNLLNTMTNYLFNRYRNDQLTLRKQSYGTVRSACEFYLTESIKRETWYWIDDGVDLAPTRIRFRLLSP